MQRLGIRIWKREVLDPDEANQIADYLASGNLLVPRSTLVPDVFSADPTPVVPISVMTDGTWVWSAAVEWYVRHHRVYPGPNFHRHCKRRSWTPKELTQPELEAALEFPRR